MNCDQRQEVITRITQELDEQTMQELQVILEQVIDEYLPAAANDTSLNRSGICDLSVNRGDYFTNVSGLQSFDNRNNISVTSDVELTQPL